MNTADPRRAQRELLGCAVIAAIAVGVFEGVSRSPSATRWWLEHSWMTWLYPAIASSAALGFAIISIRRASEPLSSLGLTSRAALPGAAMGLGFGLFLLSVHAAGAMIGRVFIPEFHEHLLETREQVRSVLMVNPGPRVAVIVVTAGVEEMLHRGVVFSRLRMLLGTPGRAAAVSSAVFAAIHVEQGIDGVAWAFVSGLMFCVLVVRTGSLVPSIVAHATWNIGVLFLAGFLL